MIDIGTNKKIYRALIDKDEYIKQITKDLLKRLYNNSLMEFIFYYSQDSKTSTNEVKKEIQEILRKLK